MSSPDVHLPVRDLDDVVTGSRVAAESQGRNGSGIHHEEVLEPPDVRHVLVAGEDKPNSGALQALDGVARVVHHVPLATGTRYRQQVVVEDEDLQVRRLFGELFFYPPIAATANLAMIEIRLARIHRNDRDAPLAEHGVPLPEHLLEVNVPDVAGVVIPGNDDDRIAVDAVDVLARSQVLVSEAERRQVPRADDHVGAQFVDLSDRPLQQAGLEVLLAAVQVGELRDAEHVADPCHVDSLRRGRGPSEATATVPQMRVESPVFQAYCGTQPPRFANRVEVECAKILDYYGIRWDYEPHSFVLERDEEGRVVSAFTPDFYLPEQNLFIEVTVMKQSLVTRKNRKLREVRRLYPHIRVKLFYRRDIERLAQRYRLRLAS